MLNQMQLLSPVGQLFVGADEYAIKYLDIGSPSAALAQAPVKQTPLLHQARLQLQAYFSGKLTSFSLPLAPEGTIFQKKVWQALQQIHYGAVASYKDIALTVGCPKGFRAVGMANHRNPIAILIPCHRVINADGSLGGYGGGLPIKQFLLQLEKYLK